MGTELKQELEHVKQLREIIATHDLDTLDEKLLILSAKGDVPPSLIRLLERFGFERVEGTNIFICESEKDPVIEKKWTELETTFLCEQSNRDFNKWKEDRQDTLKQAS
jgi:hypothetical protein